jgi:membrane-associated phospholipid phosphatase
MSWVIVAAVRGSEWIAVVFFAHIALATWIRPLPRDRRLTAGLGSIAMAAVVVAVSRLEGWTGRDWTPVVYLLAGYYLSGRTFTAPMPRVEAWLIEWDRRVLGDTAAAFANWPRVTIGLLDAAYIGCFLLVPAGFAALVAAGRVDLADRYWTLVMGAEMASFAALPYLQTRPPWVIERLAEAPDGRSRRPSVMFMKHATTGANTLPSGHAAGSLAVALAVIMTLPVAGAILLALALLIAVAAIVTRGHYVVDVVTGVALAFAIWGIVIMSPL